MLDVSRVHRREPGMTAYEVMLSESQERMLLVVPPDRLPEIRRVFDRWDIPLAEIGQVTREAEAKIVDETRLLAHLPLQPLTDAPRYRLQGRQSEEQKRRQSLSFSQVPLPECGPAEILLRLLASPNIASKHSVYRQYDNQVQTNTVV